MVAWLLGLVSLSSAATLIVQPGLPNAIKNAVINATAGDTLQLLPGDYDESSTIQISKALAIVGDPSNATYIRFSATTTPYAFLLGTWNATLAGFSLVNTDPDGSLCSLATPLALQANFSLELTEPTIRNNMINVVADVGSWYSYRQIEDISFADCSYITEQGISMLGSYLAIKTRSCRGLLGFSVKFDRLQNCGVKVEKEPTLVRYLAPIEVQFKEYVKNISPTKLLRVPVDRTGNAVTNLRVEINREANVVATVNVNYPNADLQASVTRVIPNGAGNNTAIVVITVNLPAPYIIPTSANGTVFMNNASLNDKNLTSTQWVASPACNMVAMGGTCNQTLSFNMTGCDLTGSFQLINLPLGCQQSSVASECPIITGGADINFFLQTNDFCKISEANISSLFDTEIILRTDSTYAVTRPEIQFSLGDTSYWSILIWTNRTGVMVSSAIVTKAVRISDGNCSASEEYLTYLNDVSTLAQNFKPNLFPPTVQFPLPVTVAMACASADRGNNIISFNFTILVDYVDGTSGARRRRRSVSRTQQLPWELDGENQIFRRAVGETNATKENVGISGGGGWNLTDANAMESGGKTVYIVGGVAGLGVFLCLGLCVVLGYRMRKAARKKALAKTEIGTPSQSRIPTSSTTQLVNANQAGTFIDPRFSGGSNKLGFEPTQIYDNNYTAGGFNSFTSIHGNGYMTGYNPMQENRQMAGFNSMQRNDYMAPYMSTPYTGLPSPTPYPMAQHGYPQGPVGMWVPAESPTYGMSTRPAMGKLYGSDYVETAYERNAHERRSMRTGNGGRSPSGSPNSQTFLMAQSVADMSSYRSPGIGSLSPNPATVWTGNSSTTGSLYSDLESTRNLSFSAVQSHRNKTSGVTVLSKQGDGTIECIDSSVVRI